MIFFVAVCFLTRCDCVLELNSGRLSQAEEKMMINALRQPIISWWRGLVQ
jgi:hypothetical protein